MSNETYPQQHTFTIDGFGLITFITAAADRPVRPIKITFRGRQEWSKDVGRYRKAADGEVTSRRFWLGALELEPAAREGEAAQRALL